MAKLSRFEDPDVDGRFNIKMILMKQDGRAWTGFI